MKPEKKKSKLWILWVGLAVFLILVVTVWGILVHHVLEYKREATTTEEGPTKEDSRKEEVLAYLEERYGEEFEIASYRGRRYAYDYVHMYAYPKGHEDEAHKFEIQGRINEEGKMEYVDSYVMIRLTDEYASYVDEIIDEYFDDYKFYLEFSSEWMINELPADTKVEDLLKLRANVDYPLPDLEIFMKSSQWKVILDEDIINMCKKLAEWGYGGTIHTTCYDEDIYYEKK